MLDRISSYCRYVAFHRLGYRRGESMRLLFTTTPLDLGVRCILMAFIHCTRPVSESEPASERSQLPRDLNPQAPPARLEI